MLLLEINIFDWSKKSSPNLSSHKLEMIQILESQKALENYP